jgi:hypothetical protein
MIILNTKNFFAAIFRLIFKILLYISAIIFSYLAGRLVFSLGYYHNINSLWYLSDNIGMDLVYIVIGGLIIFDLIMLILLIFMAFYALLQYLYNKGAFSFTEEGKESFIEKKLKGSIDWKINKTE